MLAALLLAVPLGAQPRARIAGSLETGAAAIEQPLIRGGGAVYIAPSASLTAHDATIGGSAVLAIGSPLWQSFLGTGFAQSPAVRNVRLTTGAQALKTSGLLHTLHADVGAEWRASLGANTAMARVSAGQLSHAGSWWRDVSAGATVARTRGSFSAVLDAAFTDAQRPTALQQQIGGLADISPGFSFGPTRAQVFDVTPRMIWERSRLRADASLALRAVESGISGARVGPQLAFTLQSARGISLFAGGMQRLPDVRSGIPSGRSAVLGLRIEGRRALTGASSGARAVPALRVEQTTLVVDAGDAPTRRVELRGDFTQWQPRTCLARGRRYFDCGTAPAAGTWRVSLRLNDGAWQQPANLAPAADDLGSVDGILLTGGKP
jgi:hypothetical protein